MSSEQVGTAGAQAGAGAAGQPSEEDQSEIGQRAAYEAELGSLNTTDMLAQAAVTLLNLGARRLAPSAPGEVAGGSSSGAASASAGGRDLEQARDAIDAVRALLEILERRIPQELRPLRDALSQLQMAYAREVQLASASSASGSADRVPARGEPAADASRASEPPAPEPAPAPGGPDNKGEHGPGPAEASGRLWVPGR